MDTSDTDIRFDEAGVCHHCHAYDANVRAHIRTGEQATSELERLLGEIRAAGAGREDDCIIGVSGGVDSTYVAYAVKRKLGLRPLAVHLDNGWDSELAVKNIQVTLENLQIPLFTEVLDWEEFRDLQLAFLKASTPDSEIPSDHAIGAVLYEVARKERVRYILTGCNIRTESHLPPSWSQGHQDWKYIKGIHDRHGTRSLRSFPHRSLVRQLLDRGIHSIDVLNYLDYRKSEAMRVLQEELGWKYYGGKHFESIYTRFYQGYLLPRKFGFDKRRVHLSSLVCSGELTRDAALAELAEAPYPEDMQVADREYVTKKLGLTDRQFQEIMDLAPRRYGDYPSYANARTVKFLRDARRRLRALPLVGHRL
jgi:N-acetyl sugar amidotransferase